MKKIYMLTASLLMAGAVSAQTQLINDGGFEGTWMLGTAVGATTDNVAVTISGQSINWLGIMKEQITNPITGAKSALLESIEDAEAADFLGSTSPKVSGYAQYEWEGSALAGKTTTDFSASFKYTYAPVGADTAFAMVNIIDTNVTANGGLLFQGFAIMLSTPTATSKSISSWIPVQAGTANQMVVVFGSSMQNVFDDVAANVGSKLVIDDVSFTVGTTNVNELTASSNVYPNPVQDVLNVEITNAEATSISIYTLSGSLVKTSDLNGVKGSINVEDLNTGMYLYTISTKGGATIQSKFLKN